MKLHLLLGIGQDTMMEGRLDAVQSLILAKKKVAESVMGHKHVAHLLVQ